MNIENPSELAKYLIARGYKPSEAEDWHRILPGGVSSATVYVRLDDGRAWVLKSALPKLRTKVDWFSPVTRIHREAAGMRALGNILPAGCVPELIFEDHDQHVIAMTAVAEPHENFKEMLLTGRVEESSIRQFGSILGAIHRAGAENSARFSSEFSDRSFFESLRLEPYYAYTISQIPEAAEFLNSLIDQTRMRKLSLVHGDYSPKNVLIHAGKLVLLDHEVIHFGDPAFDVGFAMTHLLSKANHLAEHRQAFAKSAVRFWKTYLTELGEKAIDKFETLPNYESRCVRHVLGCLLARVAGRSRLEYLTENQQSRQLRAIVYLMAHSPRRMEELIGEFLRRIE